MNFTALELTTLLLVVVLACIIAVLALILRTYREQMLDLGESRDATNTARIHAEAKVETLENVAEIDSQARAELRKAIAVSVKAAGEMHRAMTVLIGTVEMREDETQRLGRRLGAALAAQRKSQASLDKDVEALNLTGLAKESVQNGYDEYLETRPSGK